VEVSSSYRLLLNDQRTRLFASLIVKEDAHRTLHRIVAQVDRCLQLFNQQPYYQVLYLICCGSTYHVYLVYLLVYLSVYLVYLLVYLHVYLPYLPTLPPTYMFTSRSYLHNHLLLSVLTYLPFPRTRCST
jgi:hypothetical protein